MEGQNRFVLDAALLASSFPEDFGHILLSLPAVLHPNDRKYFHGGDLSLGPRISDGILVSLCQSVKLNLFIFPKKSYTVRAKVSFHSSLGEGN